MKKIGNFAFYECSSLEQITIPFSITYIGDCAFSKCSSLVQMIIPSSVKLIGDCAFYGCSSLTSISIPSHLNENNLGVDSHTKIIKRNVSRITSKNWPKLG